MHLNDERRPKINGFPAYFYVPNIEKINDLRAFAIVHYPRITSVDYHTYRLSFTLRCPDEEFTYFEKSTLINKDALPSVLALFEQDPENFIRDVFNYVFNKHGFSEVKKRVYGPRGKTISAAELSKLSVEDV